MQYFRIAEIAEFLAVPVHTVRYWEEQIPQLMPRHRVQDQRMYSLENLRHFSRVSHLIVEKGYTVQEARAKLLEESSEQVGEIKSKFEEIKNFLLSASIAQKEQLVCLEKLEKTVQDLQKLRKNKPIN